MKIRAAMKWTCTALAMFLLIVWIGSAWYSLYCHCSSTLFVHVERGGAAVVWQGDSNLHPGAWLMGPNSGHFDWWRWSVDLRAPRSKHISIPLWMSALLFGVPAAFMWRGWRRDRINKRRSDANHCTHCNYDRTGLPSDRPCPECGVAIARLDDDQPTAIGKAAS